MQFGFGMGPDTSWMRKELTDLGVEELRSPEDVDKVMESKKEGTMLLVINSVCGCAAGNARPGLKSALEKTSNKPDHLTTVFAGAFAYFVDGEIKAMIPRHRIEGRTSDEVANDLLMVFDAFADKEEAKAE